MHRPLAYLVAAAIVLVLIGLMAAHALVSGVDPDASDVVAFINAWPKKYEAPLW